MGAQLPLFTDQVGSYPMPKPCPIRGTCAAYRCETGGCEGRTAWCLAAQLAAGRWMSESRWALMGGYRRKGLERMIYGR